MMTEAEKTFLNRMAPHIQAGKSLEEAGRAVLADDERLWLAAMAKDDVGQEIRSQIASAVHTRLNRAA